MTFWTPFSLKRKSLLRCHVMTSVKTFSSKIKTISSCFMENIYIFTIFYHLITFEPRICEVWKGKNRCPPPHTTWLQIWCDWIVHFNFIIQQWTLRKTPCLLSKKAFRRPKCTWRMAECTKGFLVRMKPYSLTIQTHNLNY